jgi:hypothetical protein
MSHVFAKCEEISKQELVERLIGATLRESPIEKESIDVKPVSTEYAQDYDDKKS